MKAKRPLASPSISAGRPAKPAPLAVAPPCTPASATCRRPGCVSFVAVDGFCSACCPAASPSRYAPSMTAPRPAAAAAPRPAAEDLARCRAPKCRHPAVANGYCELHHGSPVDEDAICRAAGCTFYVESAGLHFCAAHRPGRPMPLSPNKRLLSAAAPRDAAPAAAQWGLATSDAPSPPPAAPDDAAGPAFQVLVATPAGATLRRDVRPKERVAALFDAVAAWTRLDVADLRLVVAGVVLEGHRRVRHYRGLRRNAKVHVALRMGGETPWGPCLHQWVRAIQVNGADVPVGGGDGRYPSADAFEALTRAVVGPDGRARVVVTFHGPDRAFNRQLAWGRVEPRRGGSAVDVRVDEPLRRCFGLAVRDGRRRGFEDGAPASDFLDLRPGDATAAAVAGPPQGELDHRARAGVLRPRRFSRDLDRENDEKSLPTHLVGARRLRVPLRLLRRLPPTDAPVRRRRPGHGVPLRPRGPGPARPRRRRGRAPGLPRRRDVPRRLRRLAAAAAGRGAAGGARARRRGGAGAAATMLRGIVVWHLGSSSGRRRPTWPGTAYSRPGRRRRGARGARASRRRGRRSAGATWRGACGTAWTPSTRGRPPARARGT